MLIQWRTVNQLIADGIEDLAVAHWEEAEDDHDAIPLAIDYGHLRVLEQAGNLKLAGAYDARSLVGARDMDSYALPITYGVAPCFLRRSVP